jgi:Fic family protein
MATPREKLAESLDVLKRLQEEGRRVFRSGDLSRTHRERLVANGFLKEVIKGWLISSSPGTREGDSTPWYASFWEFCARYCNDRFSGDWFLSAEQSLLIHGEKTVIPEQVVICSPKGANHTIELLFGTSLYDLKITRMPASADLVTRDGLWLFSQAAALVRVTESFIARNPVETQVVLANLGDASELLRLLLNGGHSAKAGCLAGAFRQMRQYAIADEILTTMKSAGYDVREINPFETGQIFCAAGAAASIVKRIEMLWESARPGVIAAFPKAPGLPKDAGNYLRHIDEIYQSDAYHSLSIEGYSVSPELIEKVRQGNWSPEEDEEDRKSRDALAARGYWQAFQLVKAAVQKVIAGENPGTLARMAHKEWYRELFQPCIRAGLIEAGALAGYRNIPVYLRNSRHVPPRWEVVRDAMPALFDLLEQEMDAGVRAVLGHWLFGYIHPYADGNGRIARFLMNVMLASGGFPWTVIRVEDRNAYLDALDRASIDTDIKPFAEFIAQRVRGFLERRDLRFPTPGESYSSRRKVVSFWGQDGEKRVSCEISKEALDDHFGADNKDKIAVFRANRRAIEEMVRRKYLEGRTEPDGSVIIRTIDW